MLHKHNIKNITDIISCLPDSLGWAKPNNDLSNFAKQTTPVLENLCGKHLKHTYTIFWSGKNGTDIPTHLDKEEVAYQICIQQDKDWEMTFNMGNAIGNITIPIRQGHGQLYEGMTIPHGSPPYLGKKAIWLMLGYKYGKGTILSTIPTVTERNVRIDFDQYKKIILNRIQLNQPSEVMNQSCYYQDWVKAGLEVDAINSMSIGFFIDTPTEHRVRPMEDLCVLFPLDYESSACPVTIGSKDYYINFGKCLLFNGYPTQFTIQATHQSVWAMMPYRYLT